MEGVVGGAVLCVPFLPDTPFAWFRCTIGMGDGRGVRRDAGDSVPYRTKNPPPCTTQRQAAPFQGGSLDREFMLFIFLQCSPAHMHVHRADSETCRLFHREFHGVLNSCPNLVDRDSGFGYDLNI